MRAARIAGTVAWLMVPVWIFAGCSNDGDKLSPDMMPPGAVVDLSAIAVSDSSVTLTWTAPGDNGDVGTASEYDIRYSLEMITEESWDTASTVAALPRPRAADTQEMMTVTGLSSDTIYSFALKAADEAPNWSDLSNVVRDTTRVPAPTVPQLVLIPAGTFVMGDGESTGGLDEHSVTLTRDFYLGQTEITNQEYANQLQWAYDNGYVEVTAASVIDNLNHPNFLLLALHSRHCRIRFYDGIFTIDRGWESHPVQPVSWFGAAHYCDWLNLRLGLPRAYAPGSGSYNWPCNGGDPYSAEGFRLPTDAEWEYAAQGNDERTYPWGNEEPECSRANFGGCSGWPTTSPAASYPAAPTTAGLHDMAGNVREWCNDEYEAHLGHEQHTDPVGPLYGGGYTRVVRGGGWSDNAQSCRSAYRRGDGADQANGFRVAKTAGPIPLGWR